ncbi:MAG: SpoIID/LytB domain-containing protein, partial [Bacillati bacterium ANGP1]
MRSGVRRSRPAPPVARLSCSGQRGDEPPCRRGAGSGTRQHRLRPPRGADRGAAGEPESGARRVRVRPQRRRDRSRRRRHSLREHYPSVSHRRWPPVHRDPTLPRTAGAAAHVDPEWPADALRAQAVAARTLALQSLGRFASEGYDVRATTDTQVYGGISAEDPRTTAAVEETRGEIMTYEGRPIFAAYHSDSGGYT